MKKGYWFIGFMVYWLTGISQTVAVKLEAAVLKLEKDSQMRHAILGFAVVDAKTGKILYGRNSQIGLAPASTQKILTSGAAYELLGRDYRYKTELAYSGSIENGTLQGHLFVNGSGDPTLGSWRYAATRDTAVLDRWAGTIKSKGITLLNGTIIAQQLFSAQAIPDGWIWQDIGNYYGAGAQQLNWRENQFDLVLKSGSNIDDPVEIAGIINGEPGQKYRSQVRSAAKGSGDNAYIYLPRQAGGVVTVDGTIPVGESKFTISGSLQNPESVLSSDMEQRFPKHAIRFAKPMDAPRGKWSEWMSAKQTLLDTYYSPPLDSIIYWFMRRSINLYGEALVKTIAWEKKIRPGTDEGVRLVREFWAQHGIDKSAINIIDGSGLSPQNRVTADALVQALLFAKKRPWFASFYESMPTYNGMRLKSGSIGGARAYAGYHNNYVVAIIVNNYAGSSSEIVKKLFAVLDQLK